MKKKIALLLIVIAADIGISVAALNHAEKQSFIEGCTVGAIQAVLEVSTIAFNNPISLDQPNVKLICSEVFSNREKK